MLEQARLIAASLIGTDPNNDPLRFGTRLTTGGYVSGPATAMRDAVLAGVLDNSRLVRAALTGLQQSIS